MEFQDNNNSHHFNATNFSKQNIVYGKGGYFDTEMIFILCNQKIKSLI